MFHTQRGKWGMASFTSTRTIGKIPGQGNTSFAYENPDEANAVPTIAAAATTPKPRKFFKSRAAANQETQPIAQQQQQETYASQVAVAQEAPAPPPAKQKTKQSKKKHQEFVPPAVQPAPEPEPALYIPQPSVSQDRIRETIPSKRYLARSRKVQVNYNEDESSLPAPVQTVQPPPPQAVPAAMTVPISAVSPSMEHPPIVLRISKGTSRLVSTDSEEANQASPPHQTFTSPSSLTITSQPSSSSPHHGALVQSPVPNTNPQPTTPVSNRGTRKRRSAATPVAVAAAPLTPETPPGQPRRTTRAIRRQQEEEELRTEQEQSAVEEEEETVVDTRPRTPQPGSENYELYRTLASSPEVDEKEQKKEPEEMIPDPPQTIPEVVPVVQKPAPAKRGRKKKGEAAAAAPAPPPVVNVVPVVKEEEEVVKEEPKPAPARRGRKPKAAAPAPAPPPPPPVMVVEEKKISAATPKKQKISSEVEETSPRRSTRGAATAQVTPTKVAAAAMEEGPRAGTIPSPVAAITQTAAKTPTKAAHPAVKSYGRKRKGVVAAAVPEAESQTNGSVAKEELITPMEVDNRGAAEVAAAEDLSSKGEDMDDKPLVKLVISKKKGSIFKSRALASNDEVAKNRPVYKHKWDVDDAEDRNSPKGSSAGAGGSAGGDKNDKTKSAAFDGDFEEQETTKPSTAFKPHRRALLDSNNTYSGGANSAGSSSNATNAMQSSGLHHFSEKQSRHAAFYTVKQAHQIQEIGEFQEMDDDVEYILDTLQPKYPILTRCLSAMQLSTKCMTPEFRMHVRAHGTVTQFFRVLQDAPKDRSLALCTASILFVLSQDNIGMDLDRDSLELMLNLLECDEVQQQQAAAGSDDLGLTEQQAARNKMKVRELCEEVKAQGKAPHLNLDNVTTGALAMETLLSLTSKRAGEWFKEELRTLGGLEHIVKTICECCRQISDYVAVWTEGLLEKLRKIERCLRVLDNVMEMNEQNQSYILSYDNGGAINILVKLYKLCDTELALYPTTAGSPKDSPGVAIREALVPTLKVLISLTHSFSGRSIGAQVVGEKAGVFDTSLHLLFHSSNYVPENCVFELSILVLLLMTNMTMHTPVNRAQIMEANALSDFGSQFAKVPAIKALVEFFYKCEESARLAEENADAILDAKPKKEKSRKGEEIEETVTKILQKAGNHMEHTIMASYVCILIGHLVMHDDEHRRKMSAFLKPEQGFAFMAKILEKYYNFMNLTASAEALTVAHIEATKKIIDYLTHCDGGGQ